MTIVNETTLSQVEAKTKSCQATTQGNKQEPWKGHAESACMLLIIGCIKKQGLEKGRNNALLSEKGLWERIKGDKTLREVCKGCKLAGIDPKDLVAQFMKFTDNFKHLKFPFYLNFNDVSYVFRYETENDGSRMLSVNTVEHSTKSFQFSYQLQAVKGGK